MGSLAAGSVVTVRFPFSDLSQAKFRPAGVVAYAGKGDWVLCQVTSHSYADAKAVELDQPDFAQGSLKITSYARPSKLFTASSSLIHATVGILTLSALQRVRSSMITMVENGT